MCITVRQANAVNGRAVFISNSLASHVATEIFCRAKVEMLKQFKDCDLPKGTRVGRMVMGDLGLYNEQLRKDVERWNKAIEAGIPVHEWNGTSDKIVNTFMHLFGFIIFLNILLQLYALVVDPKILEVLDRMLLLKKNEIPQQQEISITYTAEIERRFYSYKNIEISISG
ncbi:Cyclin-A1 [Trichinella spiralis]|uniref:Cyclin-A1 n=1 Tax=Trichinella spiralis TaxID=6334 RepID=A0ABR3K4D9_TRISP